MNGISRPHPAQVPTLTEIIEEQVQPPALQPARPPLSLDALPVLGEVVSPPPEQQPPTTQPQSVPSAVTEAQLAHRVLSDVQRQIDSMLEFRLKEAMAPLLARHTEAIARDLRDELNRTLKDVVARSVAQELAKLRQR
ncbi:MAG: hypothetical protein A2711_03400 [Burkholderiales bacterium RIFCSPHIGHO2_01_FULL_63_240]|jgi:hypothetical protein|nr:MAG: hypothetical protein A2711_03400 [Burkholderiales bacterium RIFCSPHIGHO2_01_FULL_63_240]